MKDLRKCIIVGAPVGPGDLIVALPRKWWQVRTRVRKAGDMEDPDGMVA